MGAMGPMVSPIFRADSLPVRKEAIHFIIGRGKPILYSIIRSWLWLMESKKLFTSRARREGQSEQLRDS